MGHNGRQSRVNVTGPSSSRRDELELLKSAKWPTRGRSERVIRASRAFNVPPPAWHIPTADLKHIAEDLDLEYE